jgi:hypothetical protein
MIFALQKKFGALPYHFSSKVNAGALVPDPGTANFQAERAAEPRRSVREAAAPKGLLRFVRKGLEGLRSKSRLPGISFPRRGGRAMALFSHCQIRHGRWDGTPAKPGRRSRMRPCYSE